MEAVYPTELMSPPWPAAILAVPSEKIMYPSWDRVEKARIRLMSAWVQAITAAKMAVKAPINSITCRVTSEAANNGNIRAVRKTPATTMVAE